MAVSDPTRAAFVTQEYRTLPPIKDDTLHANNPVGSREITIQTQIDATSAIALGNAYLTDNNKPRQFTLEIDGVMYRSDFIGGPPSFILNALAGLTDGRTLKVISVSVNEPANSTLITVRG